MFSCVCVNMLSCPHDAMLFQKCLLGQPFLPKLGVIYCSAACSRTGCMQSQARITAGEYLQELQSSVDLSSPLAGVLQEARANVQQVLRHQYTLPDSLLSSSDRDQGYATSSNSEAYAASCFGDGYGSIGHSEVILDRGPVGVPRSDSSYGTAGALLAPQQAKLRHRLSRLSPHEPLPDESEVARLAADDGEAVVPSGSDRGTSVYYASVSVTEALNGPEPGAAGRFPPQQQQLGRRPTSVNRVRFYGDPSPQRCESGHPAGRASSERRATDAASDSVRSVHHHHHHHHHSHHMSELNGDRRGNDHQRASATPSAPSGKLDASSGLSPPTQHVERKPSNGDAVAYHRSQSFEGLPVTQIPSILKPTRPVQDDASSPVVRQFPYSRYEDDRCSTCSSSSDSDCYGFNWYDWRTASGAKISYVDDMGIGGMTVQRPAVQSGVCMRSKGKQCAIS